MKQIFSQRLFWLIVCLTSLVFIFIFIIQSRTPSHERVWEIGQEKHPTVAITGELLTITNFRDFTWHGEFEADVIYQTKTFDLSQIEGVDIVISHFHWFEGVAHIMFVFNFINDDPLVISVESRREPHEEFSPVWGLLKQFETLYVLGSARDLIGARLSVREERVYRFPTVLTPKESRAFLYSLMTDVNARAGEPRFYNTITENCTNLVTNRLSETTRFTVPQSWRVTMPGFLPVLLFELGLVDGATTATNKEQFRITTYLDK